jgi:hypothetical protein
LRVDAKLNIAFGRSCRATAKFFVRSWVRTGLIKQEMVKIQNLGKSFNGPSETSIADWAGISATETLRFATEVLLKENG